MTKLSQAQIKLISHIKDGARIQFDSSTGRFVLVDLGVRTRLHQASVNALLDAGRLSLNLLGYCELLEDGKAGPEEMAAAS